MTLQFRVSKFPPFHIQPSPSFTFWLLSSSCKRFCSSCKWLNSSCWLWRRSCSSTALLSLHSTGDVSVLRPDLTKPIWNWRLMRDGLRKSNVNAEPMESGPSNKILQVCFKRAFYIHSKRKKTILKCESITTMTALLEVMKKIILYIRFYKYCSSLSEATVNGKDSFSRLWRCEGLSRRWLSAGGLCSGVSLVGGSTISHSSLLHA